MQTTVNSDLLTRADVAAMLSISPSGVGKLVQRGILPRPIKFGAKVARWSAEEINRCIEAAAATRRGDA